MQAGGDPAAYATMEGGAASFAAADYGAAACGGGGCGDGMACPLGAAPMGQGGGYDMGGGEGAFASATAEELLRAVAILNAEAQQGFLGHGIPLGHGIWASGGTTPPPGDGPSAAAWKDSHRRDAP